jgi:hypothetical protein
MTPASLLHLLRHFSGVLSFPSLAGEKLAANFPSLVGPFVRTTPTSRMTMCPCWNQCAQRRPITLSSSPVTAANMIKMINPPNLIAAAPS